MIPRTQLQAKTTYQCKFPPPNVDTCVTTGGWGPRNIHKRVRSEFAYNESKKSCRSFLLWIIPAKIIFPNLDNGWNYRNSGPERMRILDHFWTWPLHIYFGVLVDFVNLISATKSWRNNFNISIWSIWYIFWFNDLIYKLI